MEALKAISSNVLVYYLKRIHIFLESEKKAQYFPNISKQLEEVLINIVTDTEFLKGGQLDDDAKAEATKITAILKANKYVYELSYDYHDGQYGKHVLMYKKNFINVIKAPASLRIPNEVQQMLSKEDNNDVISTDFKLRCLNDTLKFVKDDSQLVMTYPDMRTNQASFVMDILSQGKEVKSENMDIGFGYKPLYAALWESMKILSEKYDFRIEYTQRKQKDMKCIVFEKIPNGIKRMRTEDVKELNGTQPSTPAVTTSSTSTLNTSSTSTVKKKASKKKKISGLSNRQREKILRNVYNKIAKQRISEQFVTSSLREISKFLSNDNETKLVLENMNQPQENFLRKIIRLSKIDEADEMFSQESLFYLQNIRHCFRNNGQYLYKSSRSLKKGIKMKDWLFKVIFLKKPRGGQKIRQI